MACGWTCSTGFPLLPPGRVLFCSTMTHSSGNYCRAASAYNCANWSFSITCSVRFSISDLATAMSIACSTKSSYTPPNCETRTFCSNICFCFLVVLAIFKLINNLAFTLLSCDPFTPSGSKTCHNHSILELNIFTTTGSLWLPEL